MTKLALTLSLFFFTVSSWADSSESSISGADNQENLQLAGKLFTSEGERSPGQNDPVRRPGLGQDPERKEGYSSERKDVSEDNTPRSPGIDKSQRTPGSEKYIITKKKKRKMEKQKKLKKEREILEKEDKKNNPFSKY